MRKYWISLLSFQSLIATTILTVSMPTDDDPGGSGNVGELRYYLNLMNTNLNSSLEDYEIQFQFPMTIQLNGILPIINNSGSLVNIVIGNLDPASKVIIDGGSTYSGFFIPLGNVTVQNMVFQNLVAQGGQGGNGISGGGGGMGAGAAIYLPQTFLNGSNPSVTLKNISITNCSAIGGNGGNGFTSDFTGNEGGGGGGGFSGNGGSITVQGITGGAGGGGFGGNGGDVTSADSSGGGGGGGGGGIGSRATLPTLTNLGNGGSDETAGSDGNGYGLNITAGDGAGGYVGGSQAGGGGGGGSLDGSLLPGGGGGGSSGTPGQQGQGGTPPRLGDVGHSGGNGGDGGGGGGGGVVKNSPGSNNIDGGGGNGGYGGGGGGGSGTGSYDIDYSVNGGVGGVGGGGGGGGVNTSGVTVANGGDSSGGGGGGGGGPSTLITSMGGSDVGKLGGGSGGEGANFTGLGYAGGGGGGGSGLGGAIFVDRNLTLTIEALSGIPTYFSTLNNTVVAGSAGVGGSNAGDGLAGTALGENIFLREQSSIIFSASQSGDVLTIGDGVTFVDDTGFGGSGTSVLVQGLGKVIYGGTLSSYQGQIKIYNANFQVDGLIDHTAILVCRSLSIGEQRGTLSGSGTLTGTVSVNSGIISPTSGASLTLGQLTLSPADPLNNALGSLVHIDISSSGTSLVNVTGSASLAGILQLNVDSSTLPGSYTILSSTGITGTFDHIEFEGTEPNYSLSYLPLGSPTYVQFELLNNPIPPTPPPTPTQLSVSTSGLHGNYLKVAKYLNKIALDADSLGLTDQYALLNGLSQSEYQNALGAISPTRNASSVFATQNVMFMFSEALNSHFTKNRLANTPKNKKVMQAVALSENRDLVAGNPSPRGIMNTPAQNTNSQIWTMGFGQFSHQDSQDQTPYFDFDSGGFFVAYDYGNSDEGCIGMLAGYANTSIEDRHSLGESSINGGYFSIYGMRCFSQAFVDAAIWGEYMNVHQKRTIAYPGFDETAKSSYNAPQLDLHLAGGYDLNIKSATLEPFTAIDWVLEWTPRYKEKGAAPYNMTISAAKPSMLRLEGGLNAYNTASYSWGVLILQGKLSYVYKKPFSVGRVSAAIVNAPASFVVESFTSSQSLISPAIELFWQTKWNGFASVNYSGEFGSGYTSNQFYGRIGYSF